jgi:membrane-associated protease RseP (regulator of RpoE activity)
MFLHDPPPTAYDLRFSVFGIPIRVHPLFWGIAMLLGLQLKEPAAVITWVAAAFVSILVHELGHAFAARACGWPPRVTLYSLGGFASYSPTYHDSKRQIAIAAAGPAAGFLLAAIVIALMAVGGYGTTFFGYTIVAGDDPRASNDRLDLLVFCLLWINIGWGVINLMPIIPLDGGRIAAEILATIDPARGHRHALMLSAVAGAAIAVLGLVYLKSVFMAIMFGYLAYQSYVAWQGRFTGGRF